MIDEFWIVFAVGLVVVGVFYMQRASVHRREESAAIQRHHASRFEHGYRSLITNTSTQLHAITVDDDVLIDERNFEVTHVTFAGHYDVKGTGFEVIIVGDVDVTEIPCYGAGLFGSVHLNPDPWKVSVWGMASFVYPVWRRFRLVARGDVAHVTILESKTRREPRRATLQEFLLAVADDGTNELLRLLGATADR